MAPPSVSRSLLNCLDRTQKCPSASGGTFLAKGHLLPCIYENFIDFVVSITNNAFMSTLDSTKELQVIKKKDNKPQYFCRGARI